MKDFAILRSLPVELTWQQVDAAAQNMIHMGLTEDDRDIAWEPRMLGVTWVRSYWEQGSDWGTCLYTACGVAYDGITEIEIEEAAGIDSYPRGFHQPREAAPLIAIETSADRSPAVPPSRRRAFAGSGPTAAPDTSCGCSCPRRSAMPRRHRSRCAGWWNCGRKTTTRGAR